MNRKTIRAVLRKKINEWSESITDPKVKTLVQENTIVTGGAIVSMLLNEDVKDFDVYFTDRNTAYTVAKYYVDKFNIKNSTKAEVKYEEETNRVKVVVPSSGVAAEDSNVDMTQPHEDVFDKVPEEDSGEKYRPIYLSSNAITLSNKIQLVIRFFGNPDEIQKNYDFVHCTSYWTSKDDDLNLRPEAVEAILNKQLIYSGSKYPVCSMIRTRKFINRGWKINAGQYLKIAFQISQLNLGDVKVLEDQLIGVDSAYFDLLIQVLEKKMEGTPSFKLSSEYISEIVDRIF